MDLDYLQLAYVTNDFEYALQRLGAVNGLGDYKRIEGLRLATRPGHEVVAHFGLAFLGAAQFEVIAPVDGDIDFYLSGLRGRDAPTVAFHHVGRHYADPILFAAALEQARSQWSLPVEQRAFGGVYAYADARAELGHYYELFTMPAGHADDVPRFG